MDSKQWFERAQKVIPGGVNSPVRAFNAVGGCPRFMQAAQGATITDIDGKSYIDYIGSWGPMILGHTNPVILNAVSKAMVNGLSFGAATTIEVEMAELMVGMIPHVDMVRMVNSGTEAVMSALRLARGYTKREKIIKFAGCYHGHTDSMLVKAGSGALTNGAPNSAGVTEGTAKDTLVAQYNNIESVAQLFKQHKNSVAAIIVEPVAANMGVVLPENGFLQQLRQLCDENGALLIFDEVITGFRLGVGGAQALFNVRADLVTFGKIIGGGLPVGAYAGGRDVMNHVAPVGNVYQAGTLSGNPLAMAAGFAMLTELSQKPEIYTHINAMGERLAKGLRNATKNKVTQIGSLVCMFMTQNDVTDNDSALLCDTKAYASFFNGMLNKGVYIAPAQFEAMFVSNSHTQSDIDETITKAKTILNELEMGI